MLRFMAGFAAGVVTAALGLAVAVGITCKDEINDLYKTDDSSSDIAEKDADQQVSDTAEVTETVAECSETIPAELDEKSC
ncbi:MAG: hypothetical protein IKK38_12840 [Spirochaetaceae bacterium]|nr:hypothetical protein [Spirochaetaceae bacterium]